MPKVKPPYPGQGVPLPNSMGIEGAWIIENIVALTINEPTTPDGEGFFQRAPISPRGNKVYTFDAVILANNFNLSVEELMAENRAGRLLLGFTDIAGTNFAKFKFLCRGIECVVDVERFTEQ
jgi:hypothetical protein